jgi:translation initiation factor 5
MIIKGENILLKCRACGTITPADVSHKLSTYIIKNPPTPAQKAVVETKAEKRERKKIEAAERKQLEDEDDNDWAVETTPEAVNQRRLALLGTKDRLSAADGGAEAEEGVAYEEGEDGDATEKTGDDDDADGGDEKGEKTEKKVEDKPTAGPQLVEVIKVGTNPIPALQKFWASNPKPEDAMRQVKALAEANQWSETNLIKIIFGSLFDKDLRKNFVLKARYLRLFVPTQKQQKLVLYCVEKLCQIDANTLPLLNDLLHGLWEENLVDDDIVDKWYKHPNKDMPEKLSKKIRDASQKFVDWLANAESDE